MRVTRSTNNPIITPSSASTIGDNINGPSVIKVPPWVQKPLGRYYLYFAHHDGDHIRLATADDIEGPWQIYDGGVLPLTESGFKGHIASPDVHVDTQARCIRMYFHGCEYSTKIGGPQKTRVATSIDGLQFSAQHEDLGESYFRVFFYQGAYYALQMPGLILRSQDPLTGFVAGPTLFDSTMRHSAVSVRGSHLCVLYTNVGDTPEAILQSWIDLRPYWHEWTATPSAIVLQPELNYEGADQPVSPSRRGIVCGPVCQLRDPALLTQVDGSWLIYTVAGESGLAVARIDEW